jgi:hypothetical protein
MWRPIIWQVVSSVLKGHNDFIFRVKQPKEDSDLHLQGDSSGQQMYG